MQIRIATINDVKRLSYLIHRNTERVLDNNYSEEQTRAWKKINTPRRLAEKLKNSIIFCAFGNKRLVGTIGLKGKEIVGLYVSYSLRRRGIGKELLYYLEQYALKKGIRQLELTSTPSAINFYKSNNYRINNKVEVNINCVGFSETAMSKTLEKSD